MGCEELQEGAHYDLYRKLLYEFKWQVELLKARRGTRFTFKMNSAYQGKLTISNITQRGKHPVNPYQRGQVLRPDPWTFLMLN
jgi:hypothetical protein